MIRRGHLDRHPAAMEPGLRDRGHVRRAAIRGPKGVGPQWSPVFATGVTPDDPPWAPRPAPGRNGARSSRPGSRASGCDQGPEGCGAAMEPGLRDRGHPCYGRRAKSAQVRPQWSPVFATGVTKKEGRRVDDPSPCRNGARSSRPGSRAARLHVAEHLAALAAMEPGLRDRGHGPPPPRCRRQRAAAMEPGLRDRGHASAGPGRWAARSAAMEPGLRDRGHAIFHRSCAIAFGEPQWSPVFATGVT